MHICLSSNSVKNFDPRLMAYCLGEPDEAKKGKFLFHLPRFGGWKKYVVIKSANSGLKKWHIGWVANDRIGISRIPVKGPVRMLIGPESVKFFGIDLASGQQIQISRVHDGKIGDRGIYAGTMLL
ncbi:MAG TPA: hypothetical protein PKA60_01550 [Candidatus Paceibacterota bacterium]|mgnify:CR=1 FL=1|nr:hypothetical protein [Candidatus Paceibacterota bacterium]